MTNTDKNTDQKAISSQTPSSDQISEKPESLSSGALFKTTEEAEQFAQTTSNNNSTLMIESAEIKKEDMTCSTEATDKYSDYEIEIESSGSYEDALFSSADELDDAIANGASELSSSKINSSKKNESATTHSSVDAKQPPPPPIELDDFFSQYTRDGKFKKGIYLFSKDGTHLPTSEKSNEQAGFNTFNIELDDQIKEESFKSLLPTAQKEAPSQEATGFKKKLDTLKITTLYAYQKAAIKLGIYFGTLLPARNIALDFNLAKLKPKKAQDHIVSPYEIKKLFETKGIKSLQVLQQADNDLAIIGKCHLSRSKRLSLLTVYSEPLSRHIKQIIVLFQKSPTAVRNPYHAELAEHSKATLKTMISGFKHVYAPLYQANSYVYGPQRSQANNLAFQLIDWLCLEQLLHMAVQSSAPKNSIKTLNTVFNVLGHYEPDCIMVNRQSLSYGDCNIKQLFIRYQMLCIVNYKKISTRQHKSLIEYIIQHENDLKIVNLNESITNSTSLWHIPLHHDGNPNYTTSQIQEPSAKGIHIWVAPYLNSIKKDQQEILSRLGTLPDSSPITTTAANNIEVTLSLLNTLSESIDSNINHHLSPAYSVYQNTAMKVITTIDDCYHYAAYEFARNSQQQATKKEDKIELPAYPTTVKSSWQLAHEDDTEIYLQTHEAKSSVNFDIAYPAVILRQDTETKVGSMDLVLISEMERNQTQQINLNVQKIASNFTGIEIKTSKAPASKAIIYKNNKKFHLICHHNEEFWKGKTIEIEDLNKTQRIICIKALKNDFGRIRIYELF